MKKLILLFIALSVTLLAVGQQKVATVNFSVRKTIGSGNLGENATFLKEIMQMANNPNFDLTGVLDDFYTNFNDDLAKSFPFKLLPEDEVLGNEQYASYVSADVDTTLQYYIVPEGFKILQRPILGGWQGDKNAMLEIFEGKVDGILFAYVYFDFHKITMMGVGVVKIKATYNLLCYNKEGKKVFGVYRNADSKNKVPVVAGYPVMSLDKILPMCESAAEELMKDVKSKMPKIVKKAGKKL